MDSVEDVVIVGAGIAGLATALGLHRLGIRSLVLESADSLRTTGYAIGTYPNAWRALDALGIGDIIRAKHLQLRGVVAASANLGLTTSELPFTAFNSQGNYELRCVMRKVLLGTLANELPCDTIRYSSKVVHIETEGCFKSIHLADGTVLKTKVLIGCDGINSVVAKYLGFGKPCYVGRSAVRGIVSFEDGHGFEPKVFQFFGKGVRYGVLPCDNHRLYWFFSFSPSPQDKGIEEDPVKLKQFILSNLGNVSDMIREVFERTDLESMACSALGVRLPWELVWGNISKNNVCVAGDALHPMTPDIGQGGCSSLEESVVLARVLAEALKEKSSGNCWENEHQNVQKGLEKYAKDRRWRSIDLISTSYMVGFMQQSDGVVMNFLRDKILAKFLAGLLVKKTAFDCGKLTVSR